MKNYKFITIILLTLFLIPAIFISGCRQNININPTSTVLDESAITTNPEGQDYNLKYSDESTTSTKKEVSSSSTSSLSSSSITSSSASSTKSSEQSSGSSEDKAYSNDFALLDYDNNKISLSDFKGKLVVVNFFGTWCVPCKSEIPDFVSVYTMYKDKNVQFIGISEGSDAQTVKSFIQEYKINYPVLIDDTLENVAAKWGITGIPTTFLFNESGEVLGNHVGPLTKDQLIEALKGAK